MVGVASLTPYFMCKDARKQAAFYAEALGGEIVNVVTFGQMGHSAPGEADKVAHMVLKAGGLQFFFCDDAGAASGGTVELMLEYTTPDEVKAVYAKLAQGGKVVMAPDRMPWGATWGKLVDQFGVTWQVGSTT